MRFKGVRPHKEWRNPKKLKSLIFMAWWRDVLIKHSQDECGVKKLSVFGNFQVLVEKVLAF